MKFYYFVCLLALNACKISENKGALKGESSGELTSCFDDDQLVYENQYNKGKEWDLYESLTYVREGGKSYLRTSSEEKKEIYSLDITDFLDGNPLESGFIEEEYSYSSQVNGLSGMQVSSFDNNKMFMVSDHSLGNTIRLGEFGSEEGKTIELQGSNLENRYQDWEDIDVETCVDSANEKCVYISNLGDNGKSRGSKEADDEDAYNLYYFKEVVAKNSSKVTVRNIHVKYEDDQGHNSEAMSFFSGDVYVTTKRADEGKNIVWVGKPSENKLALKKKCYLEVNGGGWSDVTASDIFKYKGDVYFAYRDYERIYLYKGLPK